MKIVLTYLFFPINGINKGLTNIGLANFSAKLISFGIMIISVLLMVLLLGWNNIQMQFNNAFKTKDFNLLTVLLVVYVSLNFVQSANALMVSEEAIENEILGESGGIIEKVVYKKLNSNYFKQPLRIDRPDFITLDSLDSITVGETENQATTENKKEEESKENNEASEPIQKEVISGDPEDENEETGIGTESILSAIDSPEDPEEENEVKEEKEKTVLLVNNMKKLQKEVKEDKPGKEDPKPSKEDLFNDDSFNEIVLGSEKENTPNIEQEQPKKEEQKSKVFGNDSMEELLTGKKSNKPKL